MLREITAVRQDPAEPRKRWFSSATMDLVAWFDDGDVLVAFQLCYDKGHAERVLIWRQGSSRLEHRSVDDGESTPGKHKASPILTDAQSFSQRQVRERLLLESSCLPPAILTDLLAHLDPGEETDMEGT